MTEDLAAWAEETRKEVFEYWKSNHPEWKPGFQVWYGPVDSSKNVLIIGIQPGGGEESFTEKRERFEDGDFSLASTHDYLTAEYDLARDMRKAVPNEIIESSVKTNLNFFRAPEWTDWEDGLDAASREEIEQYCFEVVQELIDRLDPDLIVTEGTASVYDKLKSEWALSTDLEKKHPVGNSREERLVCASKTSEFTLVGLKHPSSGRGLGSEEYAEMKSTIEEIY